MLNKCPFYPNDLNPCFNNNCQFRCEGGCAISLAGYSKDAFDNTRDLKKELKKIEQQITDIGYGIATIKQALLK